MQYKMFLSQKSTTLIVKQNKHKLFKLCENLQMIPLSKDTEASGGALSKDGAGRGSAGTQKSPLCIRHRLVTSPQVRSRHHQGLLCEQKNCFKAV